MEQLSHLLKSHYNLQPLSLTPISQGVGGRSLLVTCETGKYVVKFPENTPMDHPDAEPVLCGVLLQKGIPACEFLKNNAGNYITQTDAGLFYVKKFVPGTVFPPHAAPKWLMDDAARMLGNIHAALSGEPMLPEGIGEHFFRFMTPEKALSSYLRSLELARAQKDTEAEADLLFRIRITEKLQPFSFDPHRLTCVNTHGDYTIHQLVCNENSIAAVIDWTCACRHPAVWEILRFFLYAHPSAKDGTIDSNALCRYVALYRQQAPLTSFDLEQMLPLIYYQLAVCDYDGQYYASSAPNRHLFRWQARFFTRVLQHLDVHQNSITEQLTHTK
ncbi:MAG: phosphotransferase [Clostridia bacterium]|nr:phosphotransferase [Clostridia bacterium]